MSDLFCPHCNVVHVSLTNYCTLCGKAMPDQAGRFPTIVANGSLAESEPGLRLQKTLYERQMKIAPAALLAVSVLNVFAGLLICMLFSQFSDNPQFGLEEWMLPILISKYVITSVIYFGLFAWSYSSPFGALFSGATIYTSLWFGDIIYEPTVLLNCVVVIVKATVLAALIKTLLDCLVYRQYMALKNGRPA